MSRLLPLMFSLGFVGLVLLFDQLPALSRTDLRARLLPHQPRSLAPARADSLRELVVPVATEWLDRFARTLGVGDDLGTRLRRAARPESPLEFRLAQLRDAVLSALAGALAALALEPAAPLALALLVTPPVLAVLVAEQRLSMRIDRRTERIRRELPVVTEQLAMLLASGSSLSAALVRLADRTEGEAGRDLRVIAARLRQGDDVARATRAWADEVQLPAADRLAAVLALHRSTGDLGRLVANEAQIMRSDLHRQLLADLERRAQQVWVPVSVATLVPGVLFLLVPFLDALQSFSSL